MFAKFLTATVLCFFIKTSLGIPDAWENKIITNGYAEHLDLKPPFCTKSDCANDMVDESMANEDIQSNEDKKRNHRGESSEDRSAKQRKYSYVRSFHQHLLRSCTCNHEKRLVDLGPDYFPRYISDMTCLPGGCGLNYECRPKRYKLWVMRRRQEDEDAGTEPIPKDLREFWTGESVVTTIDCECTA